MSTPLRISLTPSDHGRPSIIGSIEVDRDDELPGILKAGGYLKVEDDNEKVHWVNLAHILQVTEAPEGDSTEHLYF